MKTTAPHNKSELWHSDKLFAIDFAGYQLSNHSFPRHFHDHYVIELVLAGADHFYCEGKMYTAGTDHLVLINPGEVHTGSTIEGVSLHYVSLYPGPQTLREVAECLGIYLPADFCFSQPVLSAATLAKRFRRFFQSFQKDGPQMEQEELFYSCMSSLLQKTGREKAFLRGSHSRDPRVNLLVDYLRTHYKEDISLQQMAALVSLNPFHLVRLFHRCIGITPYEYLLITRIEQAKLLLRQGYQVQQAALAAGFYDSSHLYRLLRKFGSISPKSFLSSKGQYCTIFTAS
ncbi:MAG TPA: AraC family transcriptional regulator [Chitinophagaceae bacterium]|nr:AraC family transcriptional regulator [Chitinophagaceae bacterium]